MSESTSGSVQPDPEESVPEAPATSGTSDAGSGKDSAEQAAIDDLAAKQGIAVDDVEVVRSEDVTWRDGSLGCAEPGKMYTQALVDGQRIVLRAGGEEFEYHAGGSRSAFLCERPTQ
ncbi:hypothetical protein ASG90_16150 [Nocardioides sp. Soil797]|nr:hypothetical protein ASG90_16150 [Nocardioides sp. Soil797]